MGESITSILRMIKIGESREIIVDHPKKINTIQSTMYRLNSTEPESKKTLKCKSDYANCRIIITAYPK